MSPKNVFEELFLLYTHIMMSKSRIFHKYESCLTGGTCRQVAIQTHAQHLPEPSRMRYCSFGLVLTQGKQSKDGKWSLS